MRVRLAGASRRGCGRRGALFESLERETETSVVDAQALAQGGPGERLAGAAENGRARPRRAGAEERQHFRQ